MTWFFGIVAFLFALDALRIRGRLGTLDVLPRSDEEVSPEHRFFVAPGVTLDDPTRRAASAFARARGIRVLDLVPGDLPALSAWGLLQVLDAEAYRRDRIGKGRTAGSVLLVHTDVLTRAGLATDAPAPSNAVDLIRLAGRLKRYASSATDIAIAPSLRWVREAPHNKLTALREVVGGGGVNAVLWGVPGILAALAYGASTGHAGGVAALAVYQLQPLLALAGGRLKPHDLFFTTLLRPFLDLGTWLGLAFERAEQEDPAITAERRATYDKLLEGGTSKFFEPRIDRCPLCDGAELRVHHTVGDIIQHKPGRFTLERCRGCNHIFQNPRLSLEGLGFYYRDFYDGLGADDLDMIFGAESLQYRQRAEMVAAATKPERWLDVGGGHGHFCCAARDVFPETRFDGLDLSESIDEAARRGWIDHGYRGLFPELAPQIADTYDVVSMSHYLEHTRDPKAEIDAASLALKAGGHFFIEVPDPSCFLGRLLGRLWLPWFQPQHQHFVSIENVERLLVARGFTMVSRHRGEAHQPVDFFAAVFMTLAWLAPKPDLPWRPKSGGAARAARSLVFLFGVPALILGRLLDAALGAVLVRSNGSNTYRVLARKGVA